MSAKNLTLYITADLASKMGKLKEVNWSEIARRAIERYIEDRLSTSIPPAVLERLRQEKGDEFAAGKQFAAQEILPKVSYRQLDSFFRSVIEEATRERRYEAELVGCEPKLLDLPYQKVALSQLQSHFKISPTVTNEFRKGVVATLEETFQLLKEE